MPGTAFSERSSPLGGVKVITPLAIGIPCPHETFFGIKQIAIVLFFFITGFSQFPNFQFFCKMSDTSQYKHIPELSQSPRHFRIKGHNLNGCIPHIRCAPTDAISPRACGLFTFAHFLNGNVPSFVMFQYCGCQYKEVAFGYTPIRCSKNLR